MYWLLEASVKKSMEQMARAGAMPSAEQQLTYEARFADDFGADSRILTIAGDTAEIAIRGVMSNRPSFFGSMFGGGNTTYAEIIGALAIADADPEINNIILAIDSPGGELAGMFEAVDAIRAIEKPVKSIITNVGASAAFALAVQADDVVASNRAARIGSVGVRVDAMVFDSDVTITSTEAPNKAPDLSTEEGRAVVRAELDGLHNLFVDAIAEGRGVSVADVNANFGRGGTVLAAEAVASNMIDSIAPTALKSVESTKQTNNSPIGAVKMDLATLKAEHPVAYAAALALGATGERDRVNAHLVMGSASGDMKTALAAIESGDEMTATHQAKYMAAGMNKSDIEARGGDDDEADAGDDANNNEDESNSDDGAEAVAGLVEASLGLEVSA